VLSSVSEGVDELVLELLRLVDEVEDLELSLVILLFGHQHHLIHELARFRYHAMSIHETEDRHRGHLRHHVLRVREAALVVGDEELPVGREASVSEVGELVVRVGREMGVALLHLLNRFRRPVFLLLVCFLLLFAAEKSVKETTPLWLPVVVLCLLTILILFVLP